MATETTSLRLFQPDQAPAALGLAVAYLMTKPAFATLPFGTWSKILVGQINRRHYAFVADNKLTIQGFVGYALTSAARAEAWASGVPLLEDECHEGDCLIINAWAADSTSVVRFLLDVMRRVASDREAIFFSRRYPDGGSRLSKLSANQFLRSHIERRTRQSER
jgi:hemolysin-activating ACP:hemolysin acyltransferase